MRRNGTASPAVVTHRGKHEGLGSKDQGPCFMGNSHGVCGPGQTVEHPGIEGGGPFWQSDGNQNLARSHQAPESATLD